MLIMSLLAKYPEFAIVLVLALALVISTVRKNRLSSATVGEFDGTESAVANELELGSRVVRTTSVPPVLYHAALELFHFLPVGYRQWTARMLNWADHRSNTATGDFASIKLLFASGSLLFALVAPLFAVPVIGLVLYFVPDLSIIYTVHKRQSEIRRALPQALDLMVLCVDAGLGLDATIQRVAADNSVLSGVLNEELNSLSRDMLLGMDRQRAYAELHRRTGVDELKMLGSALHQSTKMGLSIARILRAQAEFLRARFSQKAEERAAKLPVWISFPLWFCIMPALLFVIIGPAMITFLQHIGHVLPEWFN
jgi:tight adherence protein C